VVAKAWGRAIFFEFEKKDEDLNENRKENTHRKEIQRFDPSIAMPASCSTLQVNMFSTVHKRTHKQYRQNMAKSIDKKRHKTDVYID